MRGSGKPPGKAGGHSDAIITQPFLAKYALLGNYQVLISRILSATGGAYHEGAKFALQDQCTTCTAYTLPSNKTQRKVA